VADAEGVALLIFIKLRTRVQVTIGEPMALLLAKKWTLGRL